MKKEKPMKLGKLRKIGIIYLILAIIFVTNYSLTSVFTNKLGLFENRSLAASGDAIITIDSIKEGNLIFNDVDVLTACRMQISQNVPSNADNNRYELGVGTIFNITANTTGATTFESTNSDIVQMVSDASSKKGSFKALTPGTAEILLKDGSGTVLETVYVKVLYPINIETSVGERSKDMIHAYIPIIYSGAQAWRLITEPDGSKLYVKNNEGGDYAYFLDSGKTVVLSTYVNANDDTNFGYTDGLSVVNTNTTNLTGDQQGIKKITTEFKMNSTDTEQKVTIGDSTFFVRPAPSDQTSSHFDFEISDDATYILKDTATFSDGSTRTVSTKYKVYVTKVLGSEIYDSSGNTIRELKEWEYWINESDSDAQKEITSAYQTDEDGRILDGSGKPIENLTGDASTQAAVKWRNLDYSEIDEVIFHANLEMVPLEKTVTITDSKGTTTIPGDISTEQNIIVENVEFDMGKRDIIDALNKCPNHSGLDFTVTLDLSSEREVGNIELKSETDDSTTDDDEFEYKITLYKDGEVCEDIDGDYGDVTFEDGVGTVTLKDGETAKITDIPMDLDYVIEELNADDYNVTKSGDTGTIGQGEVELATFTNNKKAGDLTISNTIKNDRYGDEFTYTITITDDTGATRTDIDGTYGDVTFEDGVGTVTLGDGDSATIEDLPAGVKYTVEQSGSDGYTTTKTGETGTIVDAETAEADFVNEQKVGDLTVTNTINNDRYGDEFTYTITITDDTGATRTDINGDYGDVTFKDGVGTTKLGNGDSVTIEDLPDGVKYTVEQTDSDGYTTTKTGETGTIVKDETAKADFVNDQKVGDLTVTNTINDDRYGDEFTYTITITDDTGATRTDINGDYGDVTFKDGVGTTKLGNGDSVTIKDLPDGVKYTVEQTDSDGYTTTKTGETGTIVKDETAKADFVNDQKVGDLTVTNTINDDRYGDEFTYTITITDDTGAPRTDIDGTYGDVTFEDGVGTTKLGNGDSVTIEDLPDGVKYTVEQTDSDGYTTTKTGETGTIVKDETAAAAFVNDQKVGGLTVSNTINNDRYGDEFTYTITITDDTGAPRTDIDGTYGDVTFKDGVGTTKLGNGDSVTIEDLPDGVKYTVEQTDSDGYTTTKTGETGTIVKDETAAAAFVNDQKVGGLTVSNTINNDRYGDEFTYTITITDDTGATRTDINGTYGNVTFKDGIGTFKLKDGEKETITDLPADVKYSVTETDNEGYTTTQTGETGTIVENETAKADFVNKQNKGGLEISNTINNDIYGDEFTYTITLTDDTGATRTDINGTYGDVTFKDGVGTTTLGNGDKVLITDLPENINYTVEQTESDGYTTTKSGETGKIEKDKSSKAAFVNDLPVGTLEVTNTIENKKEDDTFEYTVTLTDDEGKTCTDINGTFGDVTFKDGVGTFTLKDGESVEIKNIPADVNYTIEQKDKDGYTTTKTGETGTIAKDETITAEFVNKMKDPVDPDPVDPEDPDPEKPEPEKPDPEKPTPEPNPDPEPEPDPTNVKPNSESTKTSNNNPQTGDKVMNVFIVLIASIICYRLTKKRFK